MKSNAEKLVAQLGATIYRTEDGKPESFVFKKPVSLKELGRKMAEPAKRGPKPLHGENMQAFHFRMTKAQREKLDRLGGAKWIRAQLEKARETT